MGSRLSRYVPVFAVGFGALVAQVVVLREMVVTFYGNELSIGVMLGSWLLWTGLGSLAVGRLAPRLRPLWLWFSVALLAGAALLVATVLGARLLNLLVDLPPERLREVLLRPRQGGGPTGDVIERLAALHAGVVREIRPFRMMLVAALGLLGPFCLLNGFLFPLACRAVAAGASTRGAPGRVYLAEAAGAAAGGAIYSFVLVQWMDPMLVACLLAAGWCAASAWVAWGARHRAIGKGLLGVAVGGFAMALLSGLSGRPAALARRIDAAFWRPQRLVSTADSRYGRVAVVRPATQSIQRTVVQNGSLAFTYPDAPAAESVVHLPMVQHPRPRRVLVLGGGLAGVLEEVLRHPSVERVTSVALDPLVERAVREHFAEPARQILDDPRVKMVPGDGRAFLKRTADHYDVVICAEGPPTTAQANRYYTLECFREVARVLAPGGVFAFRAGGGQNPLQGENPRFLACLYRTLCAAFPSDEPRQPRAIAFPGDQVQFLASSAKGVVSHDLRRLFERTEERRLRTSYVDVYRWEAALMGSMEQLKEALAIEPPPALNCDLTPRCYYYEAQRWSLMQQPRVKAPRQPQGARAGAKRPWLDLGRLLASVRRMPVVAPLVVLGVVAVVSLGWPLVRLRGRDGSLAFAVASTGLVEMAMEFTILLGFQVAYGYVYHYVGLILGLFMLGLTVGAAASSRWVDRGRGTWGRLAGAQAGICLYPVFLVGFLAFATRSGIGAAPVVAALSFGAAAFAAGLLPGVQFPVAAALHSAGGSAAGVLYGLDLFGACVGAVAVSSVLVPTYGLTRVCWMLAGLGALALFGVALSWLASRAVGPGAAQPAPADRRAGRRRSG